MDIKTTLDLHLKWIKGKPDGVRANLRGADLSGANLRGANLNYANLSGANLSSAYLCSADLSSAYLCSADLRGANLNYANLSGADLRGANLKNATGLVTLATPPEEGAFVAYKRVRGATIKILIPADAARTGSYVGRKCRAERVEVLEGSGAGLRDSGMLYDVGKVMRPDAYNPDPRVECTGGIHFFMTRKEANEYGR
jgi:Family of unknown function (DUF5758)/Pentapeptide repeats (8 copies)